MPEPMLNPTPNPNSRHPDARAYADSLDKPPPRSVATVATARRHASLARNLFTSGAVDERLLAAAVEMEADVVVLDGAADDGYQPSAAAADAAAAALKAGVVGGSVPISKAAETLGLTTERRQAATSSADKLVAELEDEAERAAEAELKFIEESKRAQAVEDELQKRRDEKAEAERTKARELAEAEDRRIAEQKVAVRVRGRGRVGVGARISL